MLSFEISAMDIILSLSVIVLLLLYWTKLSKIVELPLIRTPTIKSPQPEKTETNPQTDYEECPRGFGYIKKIGTDGAVSERCLDCYRSVDCYGKTKEVDFQLGQ